MKEFTLVVKDLVVRFVIDEAKETAVCDITKDGVPAEEWDFDSNLSYECPSLLAIENGNLSFLGSVDEIGDARHLYQVLKNRY